MSKRGKLYIILTALAILGIVALEYSKPKDINWFPSYVKQHKIPFGSLVFYEQLKRIFSKENIINLERPPYEALNEGTIHEGTYIFINDNIAFGEQELESLLDWTSNGNTLLIASADFEDQLLDTLHLDTSVISTLDNFNNHYQFQLKNKNLDTTIVDFDKARYLYHFKKIDTLNTSIVSTVGNFNGDTFFDEEFVNVIKQPFGDGQIILSTFPQAFTNYFILNSPNQNYTSGLLSYIDSTKPIYLDAHYKSGKSYYTSPLYILLNTKELKWAYYIMLIGVAVYILFEGKRKQRAIPIVKPLRNQTVDFTRTVANMYYEKGQHHEIAQHKIQHFLDYIRTQLHLSTNTINDEFIKNLAARSNNTIEDTKQLFTTIEQLSKKQNLNITELERLNTRIEAYKNNNA
ncbi:DUF4350 domain-containing protein [Ichthyenterobacterium magnum]|uniref:Uncharacterized protein DUF4350 n=1 Tax=Ichthyenterobacterium magnum TaxID=1230530 RepID=A0A420DGP1_9FLAO|nr:DUF4350 domain-containing protein [Ichthyenterobacterium magnum]RKE92247.1 uncharacterized protein DUF4350 [Ichthyenterobacterium magnum]